VTADINEVAVQGIEQAVRNAAERWEAVGAPCPTDGQRTMIRAFVKEEKLNTGQARETYRMLIHWTEQAEIENARIERSAAIDRARAQRRTQKESMTAEMTAIRKDLGLSLVEMDVRLSVKPGTCHNAEKAGGSYSNDTVASMLRRYRVEAKMAGLSAVES
jgi:hypothetical protein